MAFAETWNDTFETTPAGTSSVAILDNRIRELKLNVRERLQVEHNFSTHGGGSDTGTHKADVISLPGTIGVAYVNATAAIEALADLDGKIAFDTTLYQWKTNNGSAWTVRSPIPTGDVFKIPIYTDTAQSGWTLITTLDDKLLFITKGSAAGGAAGGAVLAAGTWTQPSHTHTGPSHIHDGPSHTHTGPSHTHGSGSLGGTTQAPNSPTGRKDGSDTTIEREDHTHDFNVTTGATSAAGTGNTGAAGTGDTSASGTGATSASATASTWRPAAYCFTIQSKK